MSPAVVLSCAGDVQMQVAALEQKAAAVRQAIKSRMDYAAAQAEHFANLPVPTSSAPAVQVKFFRKESLASSCSGLLMLPLRLDTFHLEAVAVLHGSKLCGGPD